MAAAEDQTEESGAKRGGGGKRLLAGLAGAAVLGAGGFYAMWSGVLALPKSDKPPAEEAAGATAVFVRLDPIVVTLGDGGKLRQLRVQVQLDVPPDTAAEVEAISPRILDALNTFLRAVDARDLAESTAFPRIKAQMLRRVQIIAGKDRINGLLVTEFIMN
ncbi:MAG: flagellar basal body-associated protein FliL [Paracoccaceae bacterium]